MIDFKLCVIDWSALSAIATVVATFVTWLTVREIKRQREQSVIPNIVMNDNTRFYLFKSGTDKLFSLWSRKSTELSRLRHNSFEIECSNIGQGVAQKVDFHFTVDMAQFKKFFEETNAIQIECNGVELSGRMLSVGDFSHSITKDSLNVSLQYIKHNNEIYGIELPSHYLYMFTLFVEAMNSKPVQPRLREYAVFPELYLCVNYCDIGLKTLKRKYRVSISVDSISNDDSLGTYISGVLKCFPLGQG